MDELTLKRLRRTTQKTKNLAYEIASLAYSVENIDTEEFSKHFSHITELLRDNCQALATANRNWLSLVRRIEAAGVKAKELGLIAAGVVEYAADTELIAEQASEVGRLAYIEWARYTLKLMPDLFDVATQEVASHEGGEEQLSALFIAIERLMKEAGNGGE